MTPSVARRPVVRRALAAALLLLPLAAGAEPSLKGTLLTTLPGRSFAILEYDGQSVLVHVGATIPGVGVLVSVGAKSALLRRGGSMVELSLGGGARPTAGENVQGAPPSSRPALVRAPSQSGALVSAPPVLAVPMVIESVPETPPERSYLNINGDRTPYPQIP